jgi:hypothetical protein
MAQSLLKKMDDSVAVGIYRLPQYTRLPDFILSYLGDLKVDPKDFKIVDSSPITIQFLLLTLYHAQLHRC